MAGVSASIGALVAEPRVAVLLGLLVITAWIDIWQHRIPNLLILAGLCFAIPYSGLHPATSGANGWLIASSGCIVGFVSLFPFYLVRAMGAGDVKLMAMVGAFVGPFGALCAALLTFAAGGVLAIGVLLWKGQLRRALCNVYHLTMGNILSAPAGSLDFSMSGSDSTGRIPYAVAIAAGTLSYLFANSAGLVG
jgi:prepilin peptidase CpaA